MKVAYGSDGSIVSLKVEHEDAERIARATALPLKRITREIEAVAWKELPPL